MILVGILALSAADLGSIRRYRPQIYCLVTPKDLTSSEAGIKYREIPANPFLRVFDEGLFRIYDLKAVLAPSKRRPTLQTPARANCEPR